MSTNPINPPTTIKHFVLHSGGLDSSVLFASLVKQFGPAWVVAVSIGYGQRHNRELHFARQQAMNSFVEHHELTIPNEVLAGHRLTAAELDIPEKNYSDLPEGVSPTYVPFRNGLMLALIAAFAQSYLIRRDISCGIVYYGAHADDAARNAYPDCSPEFFMAMDNAIRIGTYKMLAVSAPFIYMTKRDIVERGNAIGVDFAATWSCYKGGERHCGVCPTCQARRSAFIEAGIIDPTIYESEGEV